MEPPPLAVADHLAGQTAQRAADSEEWNAFRAAHPVRSAAQPLAGEARKRPTKPEQRNWTAYTQKVPTHPNKVMQQHLVVPFLVPQPLAGTQPIDGNPETEPRKIGTAMEHVTNIYRMQALADKHPEVSPHLRGCHNMGVRDPCHN